ncbi:MAG: hypothetical protein NTV79_09430 [Candidatus Aureabacteria bacterium]|nr:hypothetical protein [Candidatus Auribacterota bacterium]
MASHPALRYDYSMYVIRDNEPLVAKTMTPVFQVAVKGQPILKIHKWRQ